MIPTASRSNTIGGTCLPVSISCRMCCICSSPFLWTSFCVVMIVLCGLVESPSSRDHPDTNNLPRLCRSGSRDFPHLPRSFWVCHLGWNSTWADMRQVLSFRAVWRLHVPLPYMTRDCYFDWRGFNRTDTADGNSLGALFYYTSVVYSVFVIGSDVNLADVTGRLNLMCRKPLLSISSRFIHQGVVYYISGERRIKSCPPDI